MLLFEVFLNTRVSASTHLQLSQCSYHLHYSSLLLAFQKFEGDQRFITAMAHTASIKAILNALSALALLLQVSNDRFSINLDEY